MGYSRISSVEKDVDGFKLASSLEHLPLSDVKYEDEVFNIDSELDLLIELNFFVFDEEVASASSFQRKFESDRDILIIPEVILERV